MSRGKELMLRSEEIMRFLEEDESLRAMQNQAADHIGKLQTMINNKLEPERDALLKVLGDLYETANAAIKAGDWEVDGARDPDKWLRQASILLRNAKWEDQWEWEDRWEDWNE